MSTITEVFGEPIHTYTRAQAIADGVLVDVTDREAGGREAGLPWPVAMTARAFADTVAWVEGPEGNVEARKPYAGQSEAGRLWDVLMVARAFALRRACAQAQQRGAAAVSFTVYRVPATGRGIMPRPTTLVLRLGLGDDGSPVVTITLPDED